VKTIAALLVIGFLLAACNTVQGFGQDLKKAGSSIEDSASRHK
jgi:predicted small secreted protein